MKRQELKMEIDKGKLNTKSPKESDLLELLRKKGKE
jgi:hypothetical protein